MADRVDKIKVFHEDGLITGYDDCETQRSVAEGSGLVPKDVYDKLESRPQDRGSDTEAIINRSAIFGELEDENTEREEIVKFQDTGREETNALEAFLKSLYLNFDISEKKG